MRKAAWPCRRTAGAVRALPGGPVLVVLALLGTAGPAGAHAGGPTSAAELWRSWTLDPWIVLPIVGAGWLYARGLAALWRASGRGRGISVRAARCYTAGIVAMVVALVSPLDALGGALFSAHMVQHVVLMMVAAPLLVLGRPLIAVLWALPRRWRGRVGAAGRIPAVRAAWHGASHPLGAWLLHAGALWIWHAPGLYQATLESEPVHLAQHASFFGSALLFWWTAFELGRRTQLRHGIGVVYLFTTAVHSSILGALLTFSLVVWYPAYSPFTGAWGLTPLEDQQMGGLIMWVPAGLVFLVATIALMGAWLQAAEQHSARRVSASSAVRRDAPARGRTVGGAA
jgi:putative membrane protein